MPKSFKKNAAELFISAADDQPEAAPEALNIPEGYKLVRETKSERMQLLLRPAIKQAIKEEAAALGLSMNDLVTKIFEERYAGKGN